MGARRNLFAETRVGLVLGGGGLTGAAFHAGALTALSTDLGFDPRDATIIVGTSAGALTGALLRLGVPAEELAAAVSDAPLRDGPVEIIERMRDRPSFPPLHWRDYLRVPKVPPASLLVQLANPFSRVNPMAAMATLIADGSEQLTTHLEHLDRGGRWPEDELWLVAARQPDGSRTVFGRDETRVPAPLSLAVAASCAVPGYFEPVRIGRELFVDGGVISATNADVLAGSDLDLVIVLSPMSGVSGSPAESLVRRVCGTAVRREIRAIERTGIDTVLIEPGRSASEHMTLNVMDDSSLLPILQHSYWETGEAVADLARA